CAEIRGGAGGEEQGLKQDHLGGDVDDIAAREQVQILEALLFQGREACRAHEGIRDVRENWPVGLRGRGDLLPFGVPYEGIPKTLPLRERVPDKDVDQLKM